MKNFITLITLSLICGACGGGNQAQQNTAETEKTEEKTEEKVQLTGNFGEEITEEGAVSAEELIASMEGADSVQLKVTSEILTTCKMKGCWMNVEIPGEDNMRVTFKDYAFFVPTEGVEGKTVVMDGYAKKVTTDVETLKHFAKDAGKSQEEIDAITEPKEELTFVASGVIIKE